MDHKDILLIGGSQRYTSDNSGSGGGGGGGAGGAGSTTGTIGTANFGGGGGSGGDSATATGGAGGSGIVIISYTTSGAPSVTSSVTSTTNGTKTVHTFLANGTFTPSASLTVEYLVVAGGGGGGAKRGGGGGGGGYRTATGFGVTAQSYSVTVGAGGAGGTSGLNAGADGTNSIFSSITSTGGGGGGSATNGITGGSGGGGGGNDSVGDKVGGAGTSSDVTPTDVPDNSILVEKDTAKRYWFDAESANTKTVDENFDSTGLLTWTELHDTYISIDSSSNERLDFNLKRDGTNDTAYHQLSSALSDSSWVMDFDITLSTLSQTGGADAICGYIGMASSFEADNSNSHDGMYLQIVESSSINRFQATAQNSQTLVAVAVSGGTQFTTVTPSTTTFYVRLIRNGNDLTVQFFSTSARTGTATEEKTHTVSGIAGLDYITIKNLDFSAGSVGSNAVAGYIDNLKIYDGVTSATIPATWTQELPVTLGLQGWWDASASDTTISLLVDKSGNGYNLTQSTTAKQPSVVSGAQNSLNALQFAPNTGSSYASEMMQNTSIPNAKVQTVFYVGKVTKTTTGDLGYNYYVWDGSSTANYNGMTQQGDTWKIYAGNTATPAETTWGIWRNLTMQYNGSSSILRDRGSQETVALTLEGSTDTGFTLNGYANGGTYGGTQDFGELIVYNRALTTAEIASVESYLTTKWGL